MANPRPDWAYIPTEVLDRERRDDEARAWAQASRAQLGQEWEDAQRRQFGGMLAERAPDLLDERWGAPGALRIDAGGYAANADGMLGQSGIGEQPDYLDDPAQDAQQAPGGPLGGADAGFDPGAGRLAEPGQFQGEVSPRPAMDDELARLSSTQNGPSLTPGDVAGGALEGGRALLSRPAQIARAGLPEPQLSPEGVLGAANDRLARGEPFVAPVAPTPNLSPGQRIAEDYRRSEAANPGYSPIENVGTALDQQSDALDATKRIGARLDTGSGGLVAGVANTLAGAGTDPLTMVAPVVGRATAIGSGVGAVAGGVGSLAAGASPEEVAGSVESGARTGALLGAPTLATARGVSRAVRGEGGHLIEDLVSPAALDPAWKASTDVGKAGLPRENWLRSAYYFALLSSPVTHARNVVGNAGVLVGDLATKPIAVAADQVLSLMPGRAKAMSWNEIPAELVGVGVGLRVGWQNAASVFANPAAAMAAAAKHELRAYAPLGSRSTSPAVQAAGKAVEFPGRLLATADAFFRGVNSQSLVWGAAAREVSKMPGYAGRPITDPEVWGKIGELARNPTGKMATFVARLTSERVFQQDPDALARMFLDARNKLGPVGWLYVPFAQTPANIFRSAVKHSVGVDYARLKELKDPVEQAETLGRMGAALGVGMAAWTAAADDRLTGRAPEGVDRDLWLKDHAEYSVKVGDRWVSYKDVAPQFAPLIAAAADAQTAMRYTRKPSEVTTRALGGAVGALFNLNFMPTELVDEVIDVLKGRSGAVEGATKELIRPAESLANPAVVRFADRALEQASGDTDVPETRRGLVGGAVDRFKGNTPGMGGDLPTRYDVLGDPTERQAGEVLSPVAVRERPADAVVDELERLRTTRDPETGETVGRAVARLPRKIKGFEVEPTEYSELQRTYGQAVRDGLSDLFAGPHYRRADDAGKARLVARVVGEARKDVDAAVLEARGLEAAGKKKREDEPKATPTPRPRSSPGGPRLPALPRIGGN